MITVRCSIPLALVVVETPTARSTRTVPAVWALWDAVALAATLAVLVEVRRAGTMLYEWIMDEGRGATTIAGDREARRVALASWADVASDD